MNILFPILHLLYILCICLFVLCFIRCWILSCFVAMMNAILDNSMKSVKSMNNNEIVIIKLG
jgi:hypothetical protein